MVFHSTKIELETVRNNVESVRQLIAKLPRQTRRVLDLLIAGHPNKIIAWQLEMPISTVKTHVTLILRTFGSANRTHASLIAFCVAHDLESPLVLLTHNKDAECLEYFSTIRIDRSMNSDSPDLTLSE
jgi:FixJ family two-component response regulator